MASGLIVLAIVAWVWIGNRYASAVVHVSLPDPRDPPDWRDVE